MYSIMIIDDDESIGNMEQELLEREGYLVQAFTFERRTIIFSV